MAWYEKLDTSKIDQETRYRIFYYLRTSPSTFYRILHRKQPVSDSLFTKLLQHLSEQEFASLVGAEDRLRAAGILRSNGMVDYSVAVEILRRSLQDPYLKSLLLKFVAEHFREDLRKLLSLSVYGVKMLWSEDFERSLAERKKRRKVRSQETLQYYKSIFLRYLEGEELPEQLVDYVVNHENRWLRNVFMEVVPSRGYKMGVRPYQIGLGDVIKTVQYLKQHHERYHLVYRLMIEGGLGLPHAVHIVKTFNPKEVVEVPETHLETPRPVCFNDKGFCRYYAGIRGSQKPCEWAYFSTEALELLKRPAGSNLDRRTATRHATRHGLPTPKTMRKASWRTLVQAAPREVAKFIQSRSGELKMPEARHGRPPKQSRQLPPKAPGEAPRTRLLLPRFREPRTIHFKSMTRVNDFRHRMSDTHHMQCETSLIERN